MENFTVIVSLAALIEHSQNSFHFECFLSFYRFSKISNIALIRDWIFSQRKKIAIRSSLMTIYLSQYLSSKVLYMLPLQELVCHLLWSIFSFPLLYFPFTDLWKHTSSHYCFNFLFRCDSTFTVMRFFMGDALATYEFIS